ncbi:ADP-ribose pyrophosphatase [Minicystis rosea]|nr:ADP-ribose pyrophosphatase [Minicystis rosea]
MELPELPKHALALVEERTSLDPPGFLRMRRTIMRVAYADGTHSEPFEYDAIGRSRLDAVVIAAHYRGEDGRRRVILRSALRPPVALRKMEVSPIPERDTLGALWELPAGLVEEDERSPEGLLHCAARELMEEVGVDIPPTMMCPLGPSAFPAPGIIGERHFFFHVEIDPAQIRVPTEDGSPLERQARVVAVLLDEAIALTRTGEIEDEKTELALRRLAEIG